MKNPTVISEKTTYKDKHGIDKYTEVRSARVKLPNGKVAKWNYIKLKDAVVIVPVDKNFNVYLTKQWRLSWKRKIFQLPAGSVNNDSTENMRIRQARKELKEEVGMKAGKLEKLISSIVYGSTIRSKIHIYLATDLMEIERTPEPEEFIEVIRMPFKKAYLLLMKETYIPIYAKLAIVLAKEKLKL